MIADASRTRAECRSHLGARKRHHATKAQAIRVARRVYGPKWRSQATVYRCSQPDCIGWHLTTTGTRS